ncbi:MAG: alpha/beta hydrolase [Anaerolineae bacterium]|nr:alpha/beta hydrolase [Anaerolineae bacterium]
MEEYKVIQVNDLSMAYLERGDGPTVIALHAATADSVQMGWLTRIIVHEGFNVVTPDQRGHGRTGNPAGDLHLPRLVDDFLEFAYLLGRSPIHGIGYSMGGAVLLYAAQRRPDLFRSLILLGTSYKAPSEQRIRAAVGPLEDAPDGPRKVFDLETGIVVGWDASVEAFTGVTCPTLIIIGDRDEFIDPAENLELYSTLPNAELLIIPRCDHLGLVRHPLLTYALTDFYSHISR